VGRRISLRPPASAPTTRQESSQRAERGALADEDGDDVDGRGGGDLDGAGEHLPGYTLGPGPLRQPDLPPVGVGLQDRGDKQVGTQKVLVVDGPRPGLSAVER
jgi:hypothetical protein